MQVRYNRWDAIIGIFTEETNATGGAFDLLDSLGVWESADTTTTASPADDGMNWNKLLTTSNEQPQRTHNSLAPFPFAY